MGSLSLTQYSVILGSIFGDGSLRLAPGRRNALLEVNHSFAYRSYVDWKYNQLREYVLTPPKRRKNNGNRVAYRFTTRSIPAITNFYEKFYCTGKKIIPSPEGFKVNALVLAVWFMDDGSKSRSALYLNTQQFNLLSQNRLLNILRGQWRINATLNKDKSYYRIRIRTSSTDIFKKIVRPYILPVFWYKLT